MAARIAAGADVLYALASESEEISGDSQWMDRRPDAVLALCFDQSSGRPAVIGQTLHAGVDA